MWDDYPETPKPLFRRAWFIVLAALVLLPLTVATIYAFLFVNEFREKAKQFDLAELQQMESASLIYDRNEQLLGRIFIQNRDTVALTELPFHVRQAVVAAEDARFFEHHGVDYLGMARAMLKNYRAGKIREGASTLTQQLARNTYDLRERTYRRKMLEAMLALRIEDHFTKNELMEMYLNRVYFGSGFYGIEAAARGYFGKPAEQLDVSEAAMLAGLLRSPNNLSPWSNYAAAIESRNFVLSRMHDLEFLKDAAYESARKEKLLTKNRRPLVTDSYAVDLIRQQVIDLVGYENAAGEGYRIYTTIDASLQAAAKESLEQQLLAIEQRPDYEHQTKAQYRSVLRAFEKKDPVGNPPAPKYLQGAAVVLDNSGGEVLAVVGGRDFQESQYNRAVSAARPAGTAFLPFVYAAGFEEGIFPGVMVEDQAMDNRQVMIGGTTGILGEWGPERVDNRYEGKIPAREALIKSKNAASVRFGMQTGLAPVIALAQRAGFATPFRPYPATFLGSSEVTLMDMTLAYSTFPNGGVREDKPILIKRIETKGGRGVFQEKSRVKRVMSAETAYEVHAALTEVLERGTADRAFTEYRLKKAPLAGKTGTAYGFSDAWFMGYSSEVTCGVWIGLDRPETIYRGAFSNEVALPVWCEIMNVASQGYRAREIARPPGLKSFQICSESGEKATEKCVETTSDPITGESVERSLVVTEWATPKQAPRLFCTIHGDMVQPIVVGAPKPGKWPRAQVAVDLAKLEPVKMQEPTVVGPEDPYQAVTTIASDASGGNPFGPGEGNGGEEEEVKVMRAEPVRALDVPEREPQTIELEPPPPLKF